MNKKVKVHNLGINKWTNAHDAFNAIEGHHGIENGDGQKDYIEICTENYFKEKIVERLYELFDACGGDTTKFKNPQLRNAVNFDGEGGLSDYLIDFDFFFYSKRYRTYYTCIMSVKDDNMHLFDDYQWDVFFELINRFDLRGLTETVKREYLKLVEREGLQYLARNISPSSDKEYGGVLGFDIINNEFKDIVMPLVS